MHTGGRDSRAMCVERMQRYKLLKIRFHVLVRKVFQVQDSCSEE